MGRKYYRAYNTTICYQKPHTDRFLHYPGKYYTMLFYEENGKFYEFLTGTFLGELKIEPWSRYIVSDEPGRLLDSSGYYPPIEMSAEAFANEARIYMEDKNEIIPYVNALFNKWQKEHEKKVEDEKIKNHSEKEAESWLDDFLNNRK